jgi:Beta-propeller repeat
VIVTGFTLSTDFPVSINAMQSKYAGNTDVFLTILNPSLTSSRSGELVYSSYFGGVNGDAPFDLKVDSSDVIYIAGYTLSPGLPASSNALQPAWDGNLDAFVLKFDPSVLDGPEIAESRRRRADPLAVSAPPSGIDYFTYLGSAGEQIGYAVDFDASGDIFLAGSTGGPIFDAFGGVAKATADGNVDGFVAGFNSCSFSTSLDSYQFPTAGGSVVVAVDTQAGCAWTASSALSLVTVTPKTGVGPGSVTLTAPADTSGAAEQGTVTVAGVTIHVTQD